jgi:hypothetical protein
MSRVENSHLVSGLIADFGRGPQLFKILRSKPKLLQPFSAIDIWILDLVPYRSCLKVEGIGLTATLWCLHPRPTRSLPPGRVIR